MHQGQSIATMKSNKKKGLMERWSNKLQNKTTAWCVVLITLFVASVSGFGAFQVERDDDLLAFLPRPNKDVETFYEINKKFGGLDVAIVGIDGVDVFTSSFLEKLAQATKSLDEMTITESVLSITNVQAFRASAEGGIETNYLVDAIPKSTDEAKKLRGRVMDEQLVVNQLISADGTSVVIYCFAGFGTDPKEFAAKIKHVVSKYFDASQLYFGGAPFISSYIYETTQRDLQKLTPWSVIVIVILVLLAFRDFIGATLALVSTGIGIAVSMGTMGLLGVKYNIILSSMPVILFAIGSAYGIHMLARYYQLRADLPAETALREAMISTGPIIIGAGLTTVAGLISFVAMDIEPMRIFGLFTAVGIFATLVLSVTLVPAVIFLLKLEAKNPSAGSYSAKIAIVSEKASQHRMKASLLLLGIVVFGFIFSSRVQTRMDQRSFFASGSPPDLADSFFLSKFGGSIYVQVRLTGDFEDPASLREIQALSDQFERIDGVTGTQSISSVISEVNKAFDGVRRIPFQKEQAKALYGFLAGNAAVNQLVSADRKEAIIHIKLGVRDAVEIEKLLLRIEQVAQWDNFSDFSRDSGRSTERLTRYLRDRLLVIAQHKGLKLNEETISSEISSDNVQISTKMLIPKVEELLLSEEALIELQPEIAASLADSLIDLPTHFSGDAIRAKIAPIVQPLAEEDEDPELLVDDMVEFLKAPLHSFAQLEAARQRASRIATLANEPMLTEMFTDALTTLSVEREVIPRTEDAAIQVSGLPVLHRGMSRSVVKNQFKSLVLALSLVWLVLSILFRSVMTGLLASAPTIVTLLVVYGGMGLAEVNLDIGTSMLASIIIGVGVDYAVHLVAHWRAGEGDSLPQAARRSASETGPAIWTNALMVAAGFYVLTLGEAKALQNVGWLTCTAMLVASVATFVTVPALARKRRYR